MISKDYQERAKNLVEQAKQKRLIKTYEEFSETKIAKETALSEPEVEYYVSKNYDKINYNIGDIVFVRKYSYKNGEKGNNHFFVIIYEEKAIDLNYFGFLLSSNINKATYPYNELIKKDAMNGLEKDSIVKCDDLIQLDNREILFKIGSVTEEELTRFIETYSKYLDSK